MAPSLLMEEPLFGHAPFRGFQPHGLQKFKKGIDTMMADESGGGLEYSKLAMELKNKILTFRDILELPSYDNSSDLTHLAVRTIVDLHKLYPNMVRVDLSTAIHKDSATQGLVYLYASLKSVGKLWGLPNSMDEAHESLQNVEFEQLVGKLMDKLTFLTTSAKEMFSVVDEDEDTEDIESCRMVQNKLSDIYSRNNVSSPSPAASSPISPKCNPTSANLEETCDVSSSQTHICPLGNQEIENLEQLNTCPNNKGPEKLSFEGLKEHLNTKTGDSEIPKHEASKEPEPTHPAAIVPPPPPPRPIASLLSSSRPIPPSRGSEAITPPPPPPMAMTKGAPPPPPPSPVGLVKVVRFKKAASKLKRSSQMSALYRHLKDKVEGSSLKAEHGTSPQIKTKLGASHHGGKEGMAEALTEITKRSSYFKKIEEDVVKHEKLILKLKAAIASFQTKDVDELIKFQKHVEQNLEILTDETQVLSRFEGFPMKKLESLRAAAALYLKLNGIRTDLRNWKITPPVYQLLTKVESYFNKIKGELDALERSKDEEAKKFQSYNIHFDFGILVNIKESLVDISSSCMELALKDVRETEASYAESRGKNQSKRSNSFKILWRAFQLAFRIYSFAGGQDDRADRLSVEVAHEIETDAE
ncbi:hypothetical protein K1719_027203 [Acacia pycnantha]|nr:hypothetical protein K1719_027203 [Acacia pycnantha]